MCLFMSVCVYKCLCQPHANAVCQGAAPDGSEGRRASDQAPPGFFAPSRAPHCPTEGDMWNGRTKPLQSEVEGPSGSSLSDR